MFGSTLPKMAWRNLWRNTRRTMIALVSFAFGILLAILFTGMGDDTYGKMVELAARSGSGHVTFQHPDFQDTPTLKKTVTDTPALRDLALSDPRVDRVVTRIAGPAMLATAKDSVGASFMAIDPTQEDTESLAVYDGVAEGSMFASADDDGIIVGRVLAENLSLELDRKLVYTMTDKAGEMVSNMARVRGIVDTGDANIDGGLALLTVGTARKALGYGPGEATQVAVFVGDQRDARAVADALGAAAPGDVAVLDWQETMPDLAGFISMDRAGSVFFQIIIMLLLAAGIFNSLFVSVMERMREFGIMMAVGFSPAHLFGLVMWESLWLGLVGLVAAAVTTAWPYYHFHTVGLDFSEMVGGTYEVSGVTLDPIIYVDIFPEKLIVIAAVAVFATLLAGLYPAWRAGRVVPVESIKLV